MRIDASLSHWYWVDNQNRSKRHKFDHGFGAAIHPKNICYSVVIDFANEN